MKCHNCNSPLERSVCFPSEVSPGREKRPGWTVYYCTNKFCTLKAHMVPQVPRRKPVDSIEENSKKLWLPEREPVIG